MDSVQVVRGRRTAVRLTNVSRQNIEQEIRGKTEMLCVLDQGGLQHTILYYIILLNIFRDN